MKARCARLLCNGEGGTPREAVAVAFNKPVEGVGCVEVVFDFRRLQSGDYKRIGKWRLGSGRRCLVRVALVVVMWPRGLGGIALCMRIPGLAGGLMSRVLAWMPDLGIAHMARHRRLFVCRLARRQVHRRSFVPGFCIVFLYDNVVKEPALWSKHFHNGFAKQTKIVLFQPFVIESAG